MHIEAGRLRRALERYYLIDGQLDPVRIEIPKGTPEVPMVTQERAYTSPIWYTPAGD